MASDKTLKKLITREVLCFPASKLDALNSILDASRLEDRGSSREVRVSRDCQLTFARYCTVIFKLESVNASFLRGLKQNLPKIL